MKLKDVLLSLLLAFIFALGVSSISLIFTIPFNISFPFSFIICSSILIIKHEFVRKYWKHLLITSLITTSPLLILPSSTSAGPNSPSYAADDSSVGTVEWGYPANIFLSDDNYAAATGEGSGCALTHYLIARDFGFSIPSSATITGIKVEIEKHAEGKTLNDYVVDNIVKLIKNGAIVGDNKADTATHWKATDEYASYGGDGDLWGESWTPADINANDFGVALSAQMCLEYAVRAFVDHIRITVYYSEGGANNPPTITDENPANQSTNVAVSGAGVTCSVYVDDTDGDTLTITWATNASTGVWHNVASQTVSPGTTVSHTYSEFYQYDQTYWWRVYADDGTVNISETYYFHTEGSTYTTDWFFPSACGSIYNEWDSPTNAYADDGSYARARVSIEQDEDYYQFSIDVPSISTIKGIEVCINGCAFGLGVTDSKINVSLSWNSGTSWSEVREVVIDTSESDYIVGGANDLWGHEWTPSDLSNTNFKLWGNNTVNYTYVDCIKVRITYSAPPPADNNIYVITPSSFHSLAVEYKDWLESTGEYTVYIKDISDITSDSQYWATGTWGDRNPSNPWYDDTNQAGWTAASGYNDTACKVRNYIRDIAYNDENLVAVLIFGKTVYRRTYESTAQYSDVATVDMWYFGALNGTQNLDDDAWFCNSTADLSDTVIDVVVTRVPFSTSTQFWAWFNKTKSYAARAYSDSMNQNIIMYSTDLDGNTNDAIWTDYLNFTYFNILDNVGYLDCPESPGYDHCVNKTVHQSSEMTQYLNGTHPGYEDGFYMYLVRAHGGTWWEDTSHNPNDGCFNYTGAEDKCFIAITCGCGDNAWLDNIPSQDQLPVLLWQVGGGVMTIGRTDAASGTFVYRVIKYAYMKNWTFGEALRALLNNETDDYANLRTACILGDPTLRPKYQEYTNIIINGPTMLNNTYSIPGHPYANYSFVNFQDNDIDSAQVYFYDSDWQLADSYSDDEVVNFGQYSTLYSGCPNTDTVYKIKITCNAGGTSSQAVMKFKTHPYESWSLTYLDINDTSHTTPIIKGAISSNYAHYYKFEGLVDGIWKNLQEGVTTSTLIEITNTSFMSSYATYKLRYTLSASGVTKTDTFLKTIRNSYPDSNLIIKTPNGAGSISSSSINTYGATEKWDCIDDYPHDGDSTYIYSNALNAEETFAISNFVYNISYLKITAVLKIGGEGNGEVTFILKIGPDVYYFAPTTISTSTYTEYSVYLTYNPSTLERWTRDDLNNIEVGLRFKVQGIGAPPIRCTSLYISGQKIYNLTIRADGEDYFIWLGSETTATGVGYRIPGFDEASEYIAVWKGTTWDDSDGIWLFYYGDGSGVDFTVETYDVIRVKLNDAGTVTIYMESSDNINYENTRTVQLLNTTRNKGANYTGYTGSSIILSSLVSDIGLQDGEVIGYWDTNSYIWRLYVVGFSELDATIDRFTIIFTKVDDTRTWDIPGPEA